MLATVSPRMLASSDIHFPPLKQLPSIFPLSRPALNQYTNSSNMSEMQQTDDGVNSSVPVPTSSFNTAIFSSWAQRNIQLSVYFLTVYDEKRAQFELLSDKNSSDTSSGSSNSSSSGESNTDIFILNSLVSLVPFSVSWTDIHICILHSEVPYSQVLIALNGSVVGLGVSRNEQQQQELVSTPIPLLASSKMDKKYPNLLARPVLAPCIGLG